MVSTNCEHDYSVCAGPVDHAVLRADFEAVETYEYIPGARLDCAVTAFGGLADPRADEAELDGWRNHTRASFNLRRFAGDHFYLHSAKAHLLAEVAGTLRAALG